MNLGVFSIIMLGLSIALSAKEYSESQLREFGRNSFKKRSTVSGKEEKKATFRDELKSLTDAQKIRAIVYHVYECEKKPLFKMSCYYSVLYGVELDGLINDWSELRGMLKKETNPRKFYLLSSMIPWNTETKKYDFVKERSHMLFADGRVGKDEGEYTQPYAHDVSEYAYSLIVSNLRLQGAKYVEPAAELSHEQKAMVLGLWLKKNWAGCENLKIPDYLLNGTEKPVKKEVEITLSDISPSKKSTPPIEKRQPSENRWYWVVGAIFLGVLGLLFMNRLKNKMK